MLFHRGRQRPAAVQIHVPVAQGIGDRFAHGLETREVDHAIDRPELAEGAVEVSRIPYIPLQNRQCIPPGQFLDAFQRFRAAVVEVVQHHQPMPGLEQHQAGVTADKAGSTRDQDPLSHNASGCVALNVTNSA